ncbi:hypothetical protein RB597_001560 [Gaeumannomyces tritici]
MKSLVDPKGLLLPPNSPLFADYRVGSDFRNGLQRAVGHLDRNKMTTVLCSILILAIEHGEIMYTRGEFAFYTALKYALNTDGAVVEALEKLVEELSVEDLDRVCLIPLDLTTQALTSLIDTLVQARRQYLILTPSGARKTLIVHLLDNFRWSAYDKWEMHPTLHRPLDGEGWRADGSYWWRADINNPLDVYPAMRTVERIHPPGYLAQHPELQARVQAAQREEDLDLDDPEALEKFLAEEDEEDEEEEEEEEEDMVMEDTVMEDATA